MEEPHITTKVANKYLASQERMRALDVGCGSGRDSVFLKQQGYSVTAVDIRKPEKISVFENNKIEYIQMDICEFELERYDLIVANLVLPFISTKCFKDLWVSLQSSLNSKGVICGHFFGSRDWKVQEGIAWGCDEIEVRELFRRIKLERMIEGEREGPNLSGKTVLKHNFSFVARNYK